MAHTTAEYLLWTSLTMKIVFDLHVGTAIPPPRTLTGSLATPTSSADPSRTDVPPSCSSRCPRENPGRYWDMIQECARACACGLPPTATVGGLEIEAVGPLILLENCPDGSGVLCGFTFLTTWQHCRTWSMDRHPSSKGTSLLALGGAQYNVCWFSHGFSVWKTVSGFPGDSWMDLRRSIPKLSRGLSFKLCGQRTERGLLSQHVVGAAHQ